MSTTIWNRTSCRNFEQAAEKLNMLCEMFRELSAGEADSNESTPETAGEEELHGAG